LTLSSDSQRSAPGKIVELYDLDATAIGGGVHHFVKDTDFGEPVVWRGNTYAPLQFEADGFETNGQGTLPRPTIRVCHINTAFIATVYEFDDLVGATVTRWRTLAHYLDNGAQANTQEYYNLDIYKIDRKSGQNKVYIEWELAAPMDQEGRKIPGRQVVRDACGKRYRAWNGSAFEYGLATCPYTGTAYFDASGAVVSASLDWCGKKLSDCKLRFGNNPLPYGGFPGVARVRS